MAGQEGGLEPVKVFTDLSNKISATRSHFEEYSSGVSKLLKLKDEVFHKAVTRAPLTTQQLSNMAVVSSSLFLSKAAIEQKLSSISSLAASSVKQAEVLPSNPTPRPAASKPGKGRPKQGAAASIPQSAPLPTPAGPASPGRTLPSVAQAVPGALPGQSTAGRQSDSPPPLPLGGSRAARASAEPVLSLPTSAFYTGATDSAVAPSAAPVQQSPPQHQRATDFSAGPAGSSFEEASSREPQDAPLLLINPAQLSRSSSQTVPSPTVMQPSAPSSQAWATDTAVAAAATATTPEGHLPLVGGAVSGLPGTLPSAHALPPTAALQPQGSSTTDLLAAVNAVAGRLSLRHTASQSSYARLPSISEASAAACEEAPAVLAQQQGGAAADVSGSPHGLMFSVAAPGFRRTISNLRTGGPVTASLAADSPRMASLSRQTSQGMRLPANQLQGLGSGTAQTVDWQS